MHFPASPISIIRAVTDATKTYQRWITNLCIDGGVFVLKEVWPDINNAVFHQKD